MQQGRDEVMLEFFTDEVGKNEDALMEMSFFVPRDNDRYGGDGDNPACKVRPAPAALPPGHEMRPDALHPPSHVCDMISAEHGSRCCSPFS